MKPTVKKCLNCETEYTRNENYSDTQWRRSSYCSRYCLAKSKINGKVFNCQYCGKPFYKKLSRVLLDSNKYCSHTCYFAVSAEKPRTRICQNCGKSFTMKPANYQRAKYCSQKCFGAKRQVKIIGYTAQYNKRKLDFIWQKIIRERYDFICQRCGKYDQYIHAHHVATRARYPELRTDPTNGLALCNSCHMWIHQHPLISYEKGWLLK